MLGLGLLALGASAVSAAPPADGPDLLHGLSGLQTGDWLRVVRTPESLTVEDTRSGQALFVAGSGMLDVRGPASLKRPAPGESARTVVVKDPAGALIYSHSVTARGARITVIAPGRINATGVELTSFDNDDVHVADRTGDLVFSRTNLADGTLVERAGAVYGCGCERRTTPAGKVSVTRK